MSDGFLPYTLGLSLSHPFLSRVLIDSKHSLLTAIIRGVFPSLSCLLISAPCMSNSSITGNLFFKAANCSAFRLYFLSMGESM